MNKHQSFIRSLATAFLFLLMFALGACVTGSQLVDHAFGFDVLNDSPDVILLDYRYGNSRQPGAQPPEWSVKDENVRQQAGVNGEMIVGDTLYVKWRIKASGEILEDTVNLKSRLPKDMVGHRLYFVVQGRQLHVYLISPALRPSNSPIVGPTKYRYYQAYLLYPKE